MCGRFTLTTPAEIVAEFFGVAGQLVGNARYNIAPTQPTFIVRERSTDRTREGTNVQWGLVPSWAKDRSIGNKLINARGETVSEKPSFRAAFSRRRCLVVADGFYEWQPAAEKGARKQPHWISARDGGLLGFAGIWEEWEGSGDGPLESCAIITTSANSLMQPIHARMPVILAPEQFDTWLDPTPASTTALDALGGLLAPCDSERLRAHAVDVHVNSPRNDDPQCIVPLG
jgi:putative SOS response-associated peptidase YedK